MKVVILSLLLCGPNAYAELNVDSHWNAPGVTVREPNVWSNEGVMVTDPLGRAMPSSNANCQVIRMCYSNGNCVLQKVCR